MSTRFIRSLLTATVAACVFAGWGGQVAQASDHKMVVTAVGCLQTEREYQHEQESSTTGPDDEYVLSDAVIGGPSLNVEPVTEQESNNCIGARGSGQAFELKGHNEDSLATFLGRRVVIHGMLKHTEHDRGPVGTSGTFTPLPAEGHDLKLREINVDSASLVPIREPVREEPLIHSAPEPAPEAAPAVEPAPQAPAPPAAAPAPEKPTLPKTASPLPTIGLIGLLSLACGFGLRLFYRRRAVL
jgi:hypothetical protein